MQQCGSPTAITEVPPQVPPQYPTDSPPTFLSLVSTAQPAQLHKGILWGALDQHPMRDGFRHHPQQPLSRFLHFFLPSLILGGGEERCAYME
jgi:hypothetical protein